MRAAHDDRVHATAVAIDGVAVLIRGASGAGKSDLALRCLAIPACEIIPRQPQLVADDQVLLARDGDALWAYAPDALFGLLEVRGVGILKVPASPPARIGLVADLVPAADIERLPDAGRSVTLCGVAVPHLQIAPFEQSAPIKMLLALLQPDDRV